MRISELTTIGIIIIASLTSLIFTSCSGENDNPEIEDLFSKALLRITKDIGEWDEGIIFGDDSYLTVKYPTADERDLYLQIMEERSGFDCAIRADMNSNLPSSLILNDRIFYFDNIGDSIISLHVTTANGVRKLSDVHYKIDNNSGDVRSETFTTIYYLNRDDKIHKIIKALDAIMQSGEGYTDSDLKILKRLLDRISPFYYYENVESILDKLNLCVTENESTNGIIYCFTQYATKVKIRKYDQSRFGITVMTQSEAINVGATTARLGGRIYCPSNKLEEKAEWGVIVSTNPDNFTLENIDKIVLAEERDFIVKVQDLKPNTTYYYKSFVRYKNSNDHGDLFMSYGPKDSDSYVDSDFFMGQFTTKSEEVEFLGLDGATYLDWTDSTYGGLMYQSFKCRIPIDYKYIGHEIIYKGSFDWYIKGFQSIDSDGFSKELEYYNGIITFGDKMYFQDQSSGEGAVKYKLYLNTGKTIESKWIDFRYDWTKGVTLL